MKLNVSTMQQQNTWYVPKLNHPDAVSNPHENTARIKTCAHRFPHRRNRGFTFKFITLHFLSVVKVKFDNEFFIMGPFQSFVPAVLRDPERCSVHQLL